MMTPEESNLLSYLRERIVAAVEDVAGALLPGASPWWLRSAIWNLGRLGYVTVSCGPRGEPRVLQITDRGLTWGGAWPPPHAAPVVAE